MEDKIFRRVLIAVSVLLLIFAVLKIYNNFTHKAEESSKPVDIVIYTKSGCRYCIMAKSLLDRLGISYQEVEISNNADLQQKLLSQTGQNTVPYIFIKQQFIGGYSDLVEASNSGKLLELAVEKLEQSK